MDNYFTNFHNVTEFRKSGVDRLTKKEKQMLQIRVHIDSLLEKGDFQGIDGIIRGVLYSNKELCHDMIIWQNFLNRGCRTLLQDILVKPTQQQEPPLSLLEMVLDIAPEVLYIPDIADYSPLHLATYTKVNKKAPHGIRRHLEIIKLLLERDVEKKSLTAEVLEAAVWRGDEHVARYYLSFPESRTALLRGDSKTVVPVYHASRHYAEKDGRITDFLKAWIEATAKEIQRQEEGNKSEKEQLFCCIMPAINICAEYVYDENQLKGFAKRDEQVCSNCSC